MAITTESRPKTTAEWSIIYNGRPQIDGKTWHQALTEMTAEELTVYPRDNLFRPGRRAVRGMLSNYPSLIGKSLYSAFPTGMVLLTMLSCYHNVKYVR
jgi:hypothetical protein